jgi:hypothetical protein
MVVEIVVGLELVKQEMPNKSEMKIKWLYERHVVSWIVDVKKDLNIYFGEKTIHNHCIGNVINIWGYFDLNNENGALTMETLECRSWHWFYFFDEWNDMRLMHWQTNELRWKQVCDFAWKTRKNINLIKWKLKGHSQDSQNTFSIFNLKISRWQWLKMTYRGNWMASIVSNFGESKL